MEQMDTVNLQEIAQIEAAEFRGIEQRMSELKRNSTDVMKSENTLKCCISSESVPVPTTSKAFPVDEKCLMHGPESRISNINKVALYGETFIMDNTEELTRKDTEVKHDQTVETSEMAQKQLNVNKSDKGIPGNQSVNENVSCTEESGNIVKEETLKNTTDESAATVINSDATLGVWCHSSVTEPSVTFQDKKHCEDAENTNLTTLMKGNLQNVVSTPQPISLLNLNDNAEEKFIATVDVNEPNIASIEGNMDKKLDIESTEFELTHYSQKSNDGIINIVSPNITQLEESESSKTEECKKSYDSSNAELNSADTVTEEHVDKVQVLDNNNIKAAMRKQEYAITTKGNDCKMPVTDPTTGTNTKTKQCDSKNKNRMETNIVDTQATSLSSPHYINETNTSVDKVDKKGNRQKNRSVIQDIFDDWGVENIEEDNQTKVQDTVEIELKSLLDDSKTSGTVTGASITVTEKEMVIPDKIAGKKNPKAESSNLDVEKHIVHQQVDNSGISLNKNENSHHTAENCEKPIQNKSGVSRTRNLISQIASQAEVAEALKERLKEKQKLVELPRGPDIFFVKKLTQRLSSKLAGNSVSTIPSLIPLSNSVQPSSNNCDLKTKDITNMESNKEGSSDNKELLAILEGDVDPDWSNLKPPILTEETKGFSQGDGLNTTHSTPLKLDPLIERELALKQLLELPVTTPRKSTPKKKKATLSQKSMPHKSLTVGESTKIPEEKQDVVKIDLTTTENNSPIKDTRATDLSLLNVAKNIETVDEKNSESLKQDIKVDESRSGRKRKLTEKARENEENSAKRLKFQKPKPSTTKRENQRQITTVDNNSLEDDNLAEDNDVPTDASNDGTSTSNKEETKIGGKVTDDVSIPLHESEGAVIEGVKQNLSRKGMQPVSKKKVVAKKIRKASTASTNRKKTVGLRTKLSLAQKKSGSKSVSKSQEKCFDGACGDSKPKKKIINEIDRLLQDEGVVNLLYDVEQPNKKRFVPITKSQVKIMDIQKVQRELNIRKKLVRNAVLRLRTSGSGVSNVSPRSKRTVYASELRADKKQSEPAAITKTIHTASEFIIPSKMRNAADASIIVRRHSSSSLSSASGSPQSSVDDPEKFDAEKDEGLHSLRSKKRRNSQDNKVTLKISKRKKTRDSFATILDDKSVSSSRFKKSDSKKVDKNSRSGETGDGIVSSATSNKIVTRSNGTTAGKITTKSKKSSETEVVIGRASEIDSKEEFSDEEDELSACLAEAATALSVVSAGSQSGSVTTNRKNKGNVGKLLELDNSKTKSEVQSQFINKEIIVRRHGNLVQLILTPSSSTKIRNALTLQAMEEFCETLSILKKDQECRVVLLTSTGISFCEGLDLSTLLHTNQDERRFIAQKMADAVKDFIKSLASFTKPIVAGVQGAAIGLGVTMLPLFDLVIASDKATFCTPYGKLGQIAEGSAVFTLSHILGSAITSELLLGGRTLAASEALRAGLVTRVLWPDRFQVELLPSLRAMSEQSSQSMESTKALLRHSLRKKLDSALESETSLLIQHWCSAECQTAIKAYIDGKVQ